MEVSKIHDFQESLKIEREGFKRQDEFYKKYFGNLPHRVSYVDYEEIQKSDRDLFIENAEGKILSVSEKNRTKDYDDVLFEIFSNYYQSIRGWGMDSKADILAYFLPSSLVLVDMPSVVEILSNPANKITKQVEYYEEQLRHHDIWINGQSFNVPVIRARNKKYSTVSIALKDSQMQQLGIRFKRF